MSSLPPEQRSVRIIRVVARQNSLSPFFFFSVLLHLLMILSWSHTPTRQEVPEPVSVAFLPALAEKKPEPIPAVPAKKIPLASKPKPPQPIAKKPTTQNGKETPEPPNTKQKATLERAPRTLSEEGIVVRKPLPGMDRLLPTPSWRGSRQKESRNEDPINLETKDPKYVTYFVRIKQEIELLWKYPDLALQSGLQGKLVLGFTIFGSGDIEGPRLLRSSGFSILDQEAMRAVKAASPFPPIPPWIGKRRIDIIASFEYHDNRLNYGLISD